MPAPIDTVFDAGPFAFERGGGLAAMRVGYAHAGRLNAARDNAILLLAETSGDCHSYDALIGPGLAYDTDRFFVVTVDPIGGGASSQPGDDGTAAFPPYTIRDMVEAQRRLVTRELGLSTLHAVGGSSMGSFQALEWGTVHPGMMRALVLLVPAARTGSPFAAICDGFAATLTLDPDYARGGAAREGLRRAALVYYPWLVSDAHLATLDAAGLAQAQTALAERWSSRWRPDALLMRYAASRGHDVSVPFGGDMAAALARVRVPALVMPSTTDRLIPPTLTRELVELLPRATVAPIASPLGHAAAAPRAGTMEHRLIADRVAAFLKTI